MLNLYEAVRTNPSYSKLVIGDFLFAEYTCGVNDRLLPNWSEKDYFVHIVAGRKTWHTPDGIWRADPGDTLFFRKGATVAEQHLDADVCLLMVFIPDALMRSTVREVLPTLTAAGMVGVPMKSAVRVDHDVALVALFQSMRTYLAGTEPPPEPLLRLKLKELVISILSSGMNPDLAAHFQRIGASDTVSVAEIMESNFRYNLSLEEFAKLSHRSLSSFKREFQRQFQETPSRWLLRKRLEYSALRLRNSRASVTEIAFESGFEDVSHFSRVFRERFQVPPLAYRESTPAKT